MDDILAEAARLGLRWGRPDGVLVSRDAVVAEARSWLGTPFMHQRHLNGVGADCGGFVRGVSVALGLIPANYADYIPRQLHGYGRYPDHDLGQQMCDHYWLRIGRDEMRPADIVVARFDSFPQHSGIIVPYVHGGLAIIHSHSKHGVIETRLLFGTSERAMKFVAAYRLPGVEP